MEDNTECLSEGKVKLERGFRELKVENVRRFEKSVPERVCELEMVEEKAEELELKEKEMKSKEKASLSSVMHPLVKVKPLEHYPASNVFVPSTASNARCLQLIVSENLKRIDLMSGEMSSAIHLQASTDPAGLVLDAMQGFHPTNSAVHDREHDSELEVIRRRCIVLLQELERISPQINALVKEKAMKLAVEWKAKLTETTEKRLEILGFLRLVSAYELASMFDPKELQSLLSMVVHPGQAPELFHALDFSDKANGSSKISFPFRIQEPESSVTKYAAPFSSPNLQLSAPRKATNSHGFMEDEQEKYQTHFSEYLKEGVESDNIEEVYKQAAIRGQPTMKNSGKPQHKRLMGTTCFAHIGQYSIEMGADMRVGRNINRWISILGSKLYWVDNDQTNKIYEIHSIVVSAAGRCVVCTELISAAVDLYEAVFGDNSAPEGCYIIAKFLMSMLDTWERKSPPMALSPDFLVAGYHHNIPLVFLVQSSRRGGIQCVRNEGGCFAIGSGTYFALDFALSNVGTIPFDKMVESTIAAVSLQEAGTGGHVERVTIMRDVGAGVWVPRLSILKLLCRDFVFYSEMLRRSLFFVCHGYEYAEHLELPLYLALMHRFPSMSRQHLISGGEFKLRIMTFHGDPPREVLEAAMLGVSIDLDVSGCHYYLEFYEPTFDQVSELRDDEIRLASQP